MIFPKLIGRTNEQAVVERAISSGKIHHAWLLVGPKGLGKSTFAFNFAARILAEHSHLPQSVHEEKIINESHLDFKYLKVEDNDREIKIDSIRELKEFLSYKAIDSKFRVVVIDSINELNNKAANALLKSLEEPSPNTVILLVCHSLGSILPTIRSRCITLNFAAFSKSDFIEIARSLSLQLDSFEMNELYDLSAGSLDILNLVRGRDDIEFLSEVKRLAYGDQTHLNDIAKSVDDDHIWRLVKHFLLLFSHQKIISSNQPNFADFDKLERLNKLIPAIDNSYLDRINAFKSLFI